MISTRVIVAVMGATAVVAACNKVSTWRVQAHGGEILELQSCRFPNPTVPTGDFDSARLVSLAN